MEDFYLPVTEDLISINRRKVFNCEYKDFNQLNSLTDPKDLPERVDFDLLLETITKLHQGQEAHVPTYDMVSMTR